MQENNIALSEGVIDPRIYQITDVWRVITKGIGSRHLHKLAQLSVAFEYLIWTQLITSFSFAGTFFKVAQLQYFIKKIPPLNLTRIQFSCIPTLDGVLEELNPCKNLFHLDLTSCQNIASSHEQIGKLTNLQTLILENVSVTTTDFLVSLVKLRSLNLVRSGIFNLESIQHCTNLEVLKVDGCSLLTHWLPFPLPKLSTLSLIGTNIPLDEIGLQTSLQTLHVSTGYKMFHNLHVLKGMPRLAFLNLSGSHFDFNSLKVLSLLPDLRTLLMKSCRDVFDQHLRDYLSQLELSTLELLFTKVSDNGLDSIKSMTSLTNLNIGATQVTNEGLALLKGLINLQSLNIYECERISAACLPHLLHLIENHSLNSIYMRNVRLKENEFNDFMKAIENTGKEVTVVFK